MSRWPEAVYGKGREPDPRFSLANERTFLAWVRTALGLLAAGVAVRALELPLAETEERVLAGALVILAAAAAVGAFVRWARAEKAMRLGEDLPGAGVMAGVTTVAVVAVAALVCVVLL